MELDIARILKESILLPLTDKKIWTYVFLQYVFGLVFLVILGAAVFALFGPSILNAMTNPESITPEFFLSLASGVILIIFLVLLLSPLLIYFSMVIQVLGTNRALEMYGFRSTHFSFKKPIMVFALGVIVLLLSLFSVYSKKLVIVPALFFLTLIIALILAFFAPPISAIFLLIWIVLFIPMIIVLVYNGLRLIAAIPYYLENDSGIMEATKQSWELTRGNVIMIFISSFVLGILLGVVSQLVQLFSYVPTVGIFIMFLLSLLIQPILLMMQIFLPVSIYAQLKGNAPKASFEKTPFSQKPKWMEHK